MILLGVHVLEQPALTDGLARTAGQAGQFVLIVLKIDETRALNAAGHAAKRDVDDLAGQPHRFEQLRAAIRTHRGDAHLGHNL